jgi:O-antigen/teichoic acid export membrane protein
MVLGAGFPAFFAQAVDRGVLQARLELLAVARSLIAEGVVRCVVGVVLLASGAGVLGSAIALSASFVIGRLTVRASLGRPSGRRYLGPAARAARRRGQRALLLLTAAEAVASYGDIMLVRHLFSAHAAGSYAVVATCGRFPFYVVYPVTQVAFPLAARRAAAGVSIRGVRLGVLLSVGASGLAVICLLAVAGERIVKIAFGDQYLSIAHLIVPYGWAALLLGVGGGLCAVDAAAGLSAGPWLALGAAAVEMLAIGCRHGSLEEVVEVQIVAMAVFATLAMLSIFGRREVPTEPT